MVGQYNFHGALEQWGDHSPLKLTSLYIAKLSMKICDNKLHSFHKLSDVAIGNE